MRKRGLEHGPELNLRAERAKPYGLEFSPRGGFALSARGLQPRAGWKVSAIGKDNRRRNIVADVENAHGRSMTTCVRP